MNEPNQIELPLIEIDAIPQPFVPPVEDLYLVAALARHGQYWKIFRKSNMDEYKTIEEATRAAQALGLHWTNRTILHVRLGGEVAVPWREPIPNVLENGNFVKKKST